VPLSFMRREAMRGYSFLGGAGVVVWWQRQVGQVVPTLCLVVSTVTNYTVM
jgi:hypothetical protein